MSQTNVVPLYQQVKEDIKATIEGGKYAPKEKIPSEPELSAEYAVSRITIRRAIDELCLEGYLIKRQGRGTFVGTPRIHRKITEQNKIESFTETCKSNGMVAGGRLVCLQTVSARQDEQHFFNLKENAPLLYLQRVRTADGVPVFLENVFLPYEEYAALETLPHLGSISLFDAVTAISGKRPLSTNRRTIEITRASADQARLLDIPISEPLFHVNVYFLGALGEPVYIGRQYYIGSRYVFNV